MCPRRRQTNNETRSDDKRCGLRLLRERIQAREAYSASEPAACSYFCGDSESDVGDTAFAQTVIDRSGVGDEGMGGVASGKV